jgi:membrane protein implicated in regulation of membrane protease activity
VPWYLWLVAALILAVVEITSVNLVFIMLAAGAAAGAVVATVTGDLVVQALVAAVVAVLMLFIVRPIAIRHLHQPQVARTGTDALIGADGLVLERVDAHDGRVKIGGEIWTARAFDPGAILEPGTTVAVAQIDGATALVYESGT